MTREGWLAINALLGLVCVAAAWTALRAPTLADPGSPDSAAASVAYRTPKPPQFWTAPSPEDAVAAFGPLGLFEPRPAAPQAAAPKPAGPTASEIIQAARSAPPPEALALAEIPAADVKHEAAMAALSDLRGAVGVGAAPFRLRGILADGDAPVALLDDGRGYLKARLGDTIGGWRLVDITEGGVRLRNGGAMVVLSLPR